MSGLLMISNGFSIISGHFVFGPKVKPKDLRPFKNIEMTVFQISPFKKISLHHRRTFSKNDREPVLESNKIVFLKNGPI